MEALPLSHGSLTTHIPGWMQIIPTVVRKSTFLEVPQMKAISSDRQSCLKQISFAALVFVITGLFYIPTHAQDLHTSLTGSVTDPSGAVINTSTVAVNVDSGATCTGKTSKGVYNLPCILPGNYAVIAQANGFKSVVQQKVLLAPLTFNRNFSFEVGSVSRRLPGQHRARAT